MGARYFHLHNAPGFPWVGPAWPGLIHFAALPSPLPQTLNPIPVVHQALPYFSTFKWSLLLSFIWLALLHLLILFKRLLIKVFCSPRYLRGSLEFLHFKGPVITWRPRHPMCDLYNTFHSRGFISLWALLCLPHGNVRESRVGIHLS